MFTLADVPLTATHLKRRWQSTQTRCRVRLPGPRARGHRLSGRRGRAAATCAWPECGVATLSRGPDAAPCSCCSPQGRRGSVGRGLGRRSGRLLSAAGRAGPAADRLGAPPILLQPARGPGAAHPAGEAPRARPARAPRSRRGAAAPRRTQRPASAAGGAGGMVPLRERGVCSPSFTPHTQHRSGSRGTPFAPSRPVSSSSWSVTVCSGTKVIECPGHEQGTTGCGLGGRRAGPAASPRGRRSQPSGRRPVPVCERRGRSVGKRGWDGRPRLLSRALTGRLQSHPHVFRSSHRFLIFIVTVIIPTFIHASVLYTCIV